MPLKTFLEYSDQRHVPVADKATDIFESTLLSEGISPGLAKAAAIAIVLKMTQLGRQIKSPDSKALSNELICLAALLGLAVNALLPEPGKR